MVTKLDVIRNKVKLAQKAFDKSTDKVGIIILRKILKQILKMTDE